MKKLFACMYLIPILATAYTNLDLSSAQFLAQQGIIMTQSVDADYRFDDKITRAEVIGTALKIKGTTLPEDYSCRKYFTDTVKQDWVCRAIELASENDFISRANTKARPQDSITRAEAFAILFKASGISATGNNTFTVSDTDATQWQKDLFEKVQNAGIEIPGTAQVLGAYKFYPNRLATRAEIFVFGSKILSSKSGVKMPENENGKISVIDGDTVNYGTLKIRMIGLDAPESNTSRYGYVECFGAQASEHLKSLLNNASALTIEKDPSQGETDKYGRTLAYIFYNGININTQMIADGYAFEYTYDKPYKYQTENKSAEQNAKNLNLGLWSTSTCAGNRKKGTNDELIVTPGPTTTNTSSGTYTCGAKTYCSQMTTCEEAKYYLNSCGLNRLDSDSDGIPCEAICN